MEVGPSCHITHFKIYYNLSYGLKEVWWFNLKDGDVSFEMPMLMWKGMDGFRSSLEYVDDEWICVVPYPH